VLVSAGGGAAGLLLYQAALEAAQLDSRKNWRLLIGNNIDSNDYAALQSHKPANVVIERNRSDFRELLKASEVSVSQAGYNTVVDILRTGVASVLVPYSRGSEVEQTLRANKLHARERAVVLAENALCGEALLAAVKHAAGNQKGADVPGGSGAFKIDTNGAEQSASLIMKWLAQL